MKALVTAVFISIFSLSLIAGAQPSAASCLGEAVRKELTAEDYRAAIAELSKTEGPMIFVVSQTQDAYEQVTKKTKMKDSPHMTEEHLQGIQKHYTSIGKDVDVREMITNQQLWRRNGGAYDFLLVYRSNADGADVNQIGRFDGDSVGHLVGAGKVTAPEASQMVQSLEDHLYAQYRAQGNFDSKEEQTYRQQGKERANYTTHFVSYTDIGNFKLRTNVETEALKKADPSTPTTDRTVAHLQLQVSDTLANPINSESNRGATDKTANPLGRKEGERWGDLGRGLNLFESDLSDTTKAHLELAELERPDRFSSVVQDAFSWGIHFAQLDKMTFQVNDVVLAKMKAVLGEKNVTHVTPYDGPIDKGPWYQGLKTVVLDRAQMKSAEEHMFAHQMTARLLTVLDRFQQGKELWGADSYYFSIQPSVLNSEVAHRVLIQPLMKLNESISDTKGYAMHLTSNGFGKDKQHPNGHYFNSFMNQEMKAIKDAIELLKPYL